MRLALAAMLAAGLAAGAAAHDRVEHPSAEAATRKAPADATSGPALPVDIELAFDLIDHRGRAVTEADFAGRPIALFFGYAKCESICSVALPRMAAALDILGATGAEIMPILITVDPARDTPEALAETLPRWHERFVGLTGSEAALAAVRERFQVDSKVVFEDVTGPVYAHGSFIYLIGAEGRVETLIPPILGPERIAQLMRKYLTF